MKRWSFARSSFSHGDKLRNFGISQRIFFTPLKDIKYFFCHEPGHVQTKCKMKKIKFNQQMMWQMRRLPQASKHRRHAFTKYTNHFYGYCYLCNEFKYIEYKMYAKKSRNDSRKNTPFVPFFCHIKLYLCSNLGHMMKDYKLLYNLKSSRQKMKDTTCRPNNEGNADNRMKPTKVWKRKKKEKLATLMT